MRGASQAWRNGVAAAACHRPWLRQQSTPSQHPQPLHYQRSLRTQTRPPTHWRPPSVRCGMQTPPCGSHEPKGYSWLARESGCRVLPPLRAGGDREQIGPVRRKERCKVDDAREAKERTEDRDLTERFSDARDLME
ncbi:hypothetical protein E2C01_001875 [Portunus trituberculatus]|uniref:Uncharacterized protein n=1 Tax=Portunus trituberculatus TaxID=210409 RepID=A0A5B7CIQ5_PORTR|nr:hypothetical protein [Portunus trituberculatus]